jgi:hypothetical protein
VNASLSTADNYSIRVVVDPASSNLSSISPPFIIEATTVQSSETTAVQSSETTTIQSNETTAVQSSETTTIQSSEAIIVQSSEPTTIPSGSTSVSKSDTSITPPELAEQHHFGRSTEGFGQDKENRRDCGWGATWGLNPFYICIPNSPLPEKIF